MWMETTNNFEQNNTDDLCPKTATVNDNSLLYECYSEYDESTTDAGATLSTVADPNESLPLPPSSPQQNTRSAFEKIMKDTKNGRVSRYQNTYFMDGGNRFISLPTLGNTSTRAASHISRVFEDWLQNKLYNQSNNCLERLPILEDSVELLAEDVVNKLKSRNSVRGLTGLAQVFIEMRAGHVYTYHQMENGQPLITADMEDFFQQFPLFVEIIIYTMPRNSTSTEQYDDDVKLLKITIFIIID
ncbi:hypothetical protein K501DRAFT_328082 [Backusella circina FSU 941]|nr:hypothetical protein K501DRAFT_328082 [Backusella circina FSU 941]